jgi:uncharacterized protein (DUF305 family)
VRTTAIRGTAAAVLLTATVLGLAGCVNAEQPAPPGAGESVSYGPPPSVPPQSTPAGSVSANPSGTPTAAHNQADVTFAQQVELLRQQAISMANAAGASSTNTQVKALASQITHDAGPSVGVVQNLLVRWNQTAGDQQSPGVLSTTQLQQVTSAKGTAFDMQWLQFMKANLNATQQAVTTETSKGADQQAVQIAKQWAAALSAELVKIGIIG